MIHAALEDRSLLLWGERRSASGTPFFSPLDAEELLTVLSEHLNFGNSELELLKRSGTISLPAANGEALTFFGDSNSSGSETKTFALSFLSLAPAEALKVLAGLASYRHRRLLAPGIVLGNEITTVIDLMRLAGRIVAAQQFLPALRYDERELNYLAEWQVVLNSAELNYIAQMSKSMPAVTFALKTDSRKPELTAAATDRVKTIRKFLGGLVDYIVRSATSSTIKLPAKAIRVPPRRVPRRGPLKLNSDKPSSVHESWLAALTATNNVIDYDQDELKKFARQLIEWQRPVVSRTEAPFRLCFRLDEPPPLNSDEMETLLELESMSLHNGYTEQLRRRQAASNNGKWKISYHLQSQADQSLLIDAEKVWHGNKTEKAILSADGFNAREHLLFSLGQASKLFPELEQGLRAKAPSAHEINNDSALDFLKEKALL